MEVIVVLGVVVALTAFAYWRPNPVPALRKELERIPATEIGALVEGAQGVRVIGAAVQLEGSEEYVTGPYSGRPGLAIVYERYAVHGKYRRLELLDRQVRHVPFALADHTGTILLDLTHVRFGLDMAIAELGDRGPNRIFGASVVASNQLGTEQHEEGGVVPDNELTVKGRVVRRPDGTLVLAGTATDPLVVVALPESRFTRGRA